MKVTLNMEQFSYDQRSCLVDIVVKSSSYDVALEFSRCCAADVRERLAKKINYPDILEKLSSDCEVGVRTVVAGNENTPSNVLEKLSSDCEASVRKAVAGNENTPSNVLEKLSSDCEADVRRMIILNRNTSNQVLNNLSKDAERCIRELAKLLLEARAF